MYVEYFFFSSRRRHTRWPRDWSSDVCSSDLLEIRRAREALRRLACDHPDRSDAALRGRAHGIEEIGRASCRESVEMTVERRIVKTKKANKSCTVIRKHAHKHLTIKSIGITSG